MDGQEYLNQISANNRPVKKSKFGGLMSSKIMLFGLISVVALIVIIVIGSLIGGSKKDIKSLGLDLFFHINSTAEIIGTYQNDIKSSDLRASASSLGGILNNTSKDLDGYLAEKYKIKTKNAEKTMSKTIADNKQALNDELFEAKINGVLDRIFANKMSYEISLIAAEESKVINSTGDSILKDLLTKSYSSLENLYSNFNDFSEAK